MMVLSVVMRKLVFGEGTDEDMEDDGVKMVMIVMMLEQILISYAMLMLMLVVMLYQGWSRYCD